MDVAKGLVGMWCFVARSTVANVHVVQMGDEKRLRESGDRVASIRHLCEVQKYSHTIDAWNATRFECPYTAKVETIDAHLRRIPDGDWLVWMDLDVQYQHPRCSAWWRALPTRSADGTPCHLVALRTRATINTGIVHVKATTEMRAFVADWLREQVTRGYCGGPADQLSLQTVMLRAAVAGYDGRCEEAQKGPYDPALLNACFSREMGAPPANVCLMSCADRLQKHDCGNQTDLRRGEYLFRHVRGRKLNRSAGLCTDDDDAGSTGPGPGGGSISWEEFVGSLGDLASASDAATRATAPFWLAAALAAACALAATSC